MAQSVFKKHEWKWATYSSRQEDEWIPMYVLAKKTVFGGNLYRVRDWMARLFFCEDAARYMGSKMAIQGPGTNFWSDSVGKTISSCWSLEGEEHELKDRHVFQFLAQEFPIKPGSSNKYLWNVRTFLEWLQSKKDGGFKKVVSTSVGYHLVLA